MIKEFREFILRGNLVDLAVAVVVGTAFAALITSFVTSLLTPLITCLSVAAAVFFFVVKPMNLLMERVRRGEAPAEETEPQILVLEEIRDLLAKQRGQGSVG